MKMLTCKTTLRRISEYVPYKYMYNIYVYNLYMVHVYILCVYIIIMNVHKCVIHLRQCQTEQTKLYMKTRPSRIVELNVLTMRKTLNLKLFSVIYHSVTHFSCETYIRMPDIKDKTNKVPGNSTLQKRGSNLGGMKSSSMEKIQVQNHKFVNLWLIKLHSFLYLYSYLLFLIFFYLIFYHFFREEIFWLIFHQHTPLQLSLAQPGF